MRNKTKTRPDWEPKQVISNPAAVIQFLVTALTTKTELLNRKAGRNVTLFRYVYILCISFDMYILYNLQPLNFTFTEASLVNSEVKVKFK